MWFIGGGGRVYIDCWRELDIFGEPAPTGLLTLVQNIRWGAGLYRLLAGVRYFWRTRPYRVIDFGTKYQFISTYLLRT
jgi:hypothetical protein